MLLGNQVFLGVLLNWCTALGQLGVVPKQYTRQVYTYSKLFKVGISRIRNNQVWLDNLKNKVQINRRIVKVQSKGINGNNWNCEQNQINYL